MRIAIHSADLDSARIDGTRVYIYNVLKWLGEIDSADIFLVYHGQKFNPRLAPVEYDNFKIKSLPKFPFWTQILFALQLKRDKPDVLWMPVHNIPVFKSKKIRAVVTIHDLAFKYFPEHFPKKDLFKLNILASLAINRSDHIIAVSQSTKNDILKFYPHIKEEKITVIHHGFDSELFQQESSQLESAELLKSYSLNPKSYLLYVGAIQPRKNLGVLLDAFEKIKEERENLKFVIAGAPAWMHGEIMEKIKSSKYSQDIIITGTIPFSQMPLLYKNAGVFVFPSLYEGFGMPVLEAMASGIPVVCANNSSFHEVAGNAALYFKDDSSEDLKEKITSILQDEKLVGELSAKGIERAKNFSWKKCAQETLEVLKTKN